MTRGNTKCSKALAVLYAVNADHSVKDGTLSFPVAAHPLCLRM